MAGRLSDVSPPHLSMNHTATCDDAATAGLIHPYRCPKLMEEGYCRLTCQRRGYHSEADDHPSLTVPPLPAIERSAVPHTQASSLPVLLTSDWHMEPWYDTSGRGVVDGDSRVSRYSDSTLQNAWTCQDGSGRTVTCTVTGYHDPPVDFIESHLQWFSEQFVEPGESPLLLFIGDTSTHKVTGGGTTVYSWVETVSLITERAVRSLMAVSAPSNIFYVNGNNDAVHNAAFVSTNDPDR